MKTWPGNKEETSVVVVESASSVRLQLVDVLRELGFKKVHGLVSGTDCLHQLETETIDWLIMPLLAGGEVNALQILKLISLEPQLRSTKCSVFLDLSSEDYCLPLAFELGLLSWHQKSYAKENLLTDLRDMGEVAKTNNGNPTLIAAEYIRRHTTARRLHQSRLSLEQNLLAMYPGTAKLLVNLAEAEFAGGNGRRAGALLKQAELIDDDLVPRCERLRDKHKDLILPSEEDQKENILGLKSVVVVDPDTDVLYAAGELLKNIGVKSVECFEDGDKAAAWLATATAPDLLLMEWRIPGLAGAALVQRVRQLGYLHTQIVVVSSLLRREDKPLLREMGVDEVLEKPFDHTAFYAAVIWTVQQNRAPTEQRSLQRKIRRLLANNDTSEAERLIAQLVNDERIEAAAKNETKAEYEFHFGHLRAALKYSAEALKIGGGDSLALLNLAGKCLLKLKQHREALRCFERANEISSMNIERLANIAEINLHLGKDAAAKSAIEVGREIDPNNPLLAEVRGKYALQTGDAATAQEALAGLGMLTRVASYINNRAVALIMAGRFEEGIGLYQRAIQALPSNAGETKATVQYNLGLAYVRYGDYERAAKMLAAVCANKDLKIFKKAAALAQRLTTNVGKGTAVLSEQLAADHPMELDEGGQSEETEAAVGDMAERWQDLLAKIEARRGDICCYQVFRSVEDIDPRAHALVAWTPRFVSRLAIARPETQPKAAEG